MSSASNVPDRPVKSPNSQKKSWLPMLLILIAVGYVALVLLVPAVNVFYQAFRNGVGPFLNTLKKHDFQVAVGITVGLALITVPINTIFGLCAAWALARKRFPGRTLILSLIDLPFSISPVVAGLMIVLVYGRVGWLGPWLLDNNIHIIFAFPGMVLATAFVSLPFVAREVIPVLEEVGPEQEEAAKILGASEWQTFWRVSLPNIRWGLLYGVLLTNARAMGEFGAVAVVSGNIAGKTQSLPLFVEEAYKNYQTESAYGAAVILGLLAVFTLVVQELLERRTRIKDVQE